MRFTPCIAPPALTREPCVFGTVWGELHRRRRHGSGEYELCGRFRAKAVAPPAGTVLSTTADYHVHGYGRPAARDGLPYLGGQALASRRAQAPVPSRRTAGSFSVPTSTTCSTASNPSRSRRDSPSLPRHGENIRKEAACDAWALAPRRSPASGTALRLCRPWQAGTACGASGAGSLSRLAATRHPGLPQCCGESDAAGKVSEGIAAISSDTLARPGSPPPSPQHRGPGVERPEGLSAEDMVRHRPMSRRHPHAVGTDGETAIAGTARLLRPGMGRLCEGGTEPMSPSRQSEAILRAKGDGLRSGGRQGVSPLAATGETADHVERRLRRSSSEADTEEGPGPQADARIRGRDRGLRERPGGPARPPAPGGAEARHAGGEVPRRSVLRAGRNIPPGDGSYPS